MKLKTYLAGLLATLAACTLFTFPVWAAEDLPVEQASERGATISSEVDIASNHSPKMGTQYFMYILPDPVYEMPKMGDESIGQRQLIFIALGTGFGYLGVHFYAQKRHHE